MNSHQFNGTIHLTPSTFNNSNITNSTINNQQSSPKQTTRINVFKNVNIFGPQNNTNPNLDEKMTSSRLGGSSTVSKSTAVVKRHTSFQQFTTLPRNFNGNIQAPQQVQFYSNQPRNNNQIQSNTNQNANHVYQYDQALASLIHYYSTQKNAFPKSSAPLLTASEPSKLNSHPPIRINAASNTKSDGSVFGGLCIRFAVNGLSKFAKSGSGGQTPSVNRNLQAGDFGDDAGMIAENNKCIVIGLADGAGGNRSIGIDPQKFSRALMAYCVEIVKSEDIGSANLTRLACKSVQTLETKNIEGSIK
jgi:hypothetical protein